MLITFIQNGAVDLDPDEINSEVQIESIWLHKIPITKP